MSNASIESSAQGAPWLLLIHAIPPKPDYFRVKVRRRLERLGAVALKNSVYVLPNNDESREDFEWLAREIAGEGGEATVCEATFVAGITDEEIHRMFDARDGQMVGRSDGQVASAKAPRGATWVTRAGVKVDRIGSAWLIRRFIDPEARFRFAPATGGRQQAGEISFDMFGGDYTHEDDRCTFETLLARFELRDPALRQIAEIVHDVDCKDEKFARPEAGGVASMINGIAAANPRDEDRLARGATVFDDLHAAFSKPS